MQTCGNSQRDENHKLNDTKPLFSARSFISLFLSGSDIQVCPFHKVTHKLMFCFYFIKPNSYEPISVGQCLAVQLHFLYMQENALICSKSVFVLQQLLFCWFWQDHKLQIVLNLPYNVYFSDLQHSGMTAVLRLFPQSLHEQSACLFYWYGWSWSADSLFMTTMTRAFKKMLSDSHRSVALNITFLLQGVCLVLDLQACCFVTSKTKQTFSHFFLRFYIFFISCSLSFLFDERAILKYKHAALFQVTVRFSLLDCKVKKSNNINLYVHVFMSSSRWQLKPFEPKTTKMAETQSVLQLKWVWK